MRSAVQDRKLQDFGDELLDKMFETEHDPAPPDEKRLGRTALRHSRRQYRQIEPRRRRGGRRPSGVAVDVENVGLRHVTLPWLLRSPPSARR